MTLRNLRAALAAFVLLSLLPLPALGQADGSDQPPESPASTAAGPAETPSGAIEGSDAAKPAPVIRPRGNRAPAPVRAKESLFTYTEEKANGVKIALAIIVVALLVWGMVLEEKGRAHLYRTQRRAALALLGVLGVFGWFNYGKFHNGTFVHVWEHYHYYIGAKYLPELHYARLYECSAIAEVEQGRRAKVEKRNMRDIAETNLIGSTADILANPERCKQHFSEARWEEFKQDVAFFYRRMGDGQWERSQKDHGYNGTPWWSIAGTALANAIGPASEGSMRLLGLIDPALLLLMFGMIWWAFGLESFVVAATFFAVNYPSRYWWNGGAYLRYDYLAAAVGGVCLLKKNKSALGGAALAFAASARIFPVMFVVGPVLQAAYRFWKDKKLPHEHRRILIGAVIATAILVPASLVVAQTGPQIYEHFTHNTLKHAKTPLTNHMGLRTVLSWRPADNAQHLKDPRAADPFKVWKEKRLENYDELKWLFVLLNLALAGAILLASKDDKAWVAAALSGMLLVTSATELTCYYYGYLMVGAFLMEKRKEFGLWLILVGISTHAIARLRIWDDEKYVWMTVSSLAYGVAVLYLMLRPEKKASTEAVEALGPAVLAGADGATAAVDSGGSRKKKKR